MKTVLNKNNNSSNDLKIETPSELISILEDNDIETDDLIIKDETDEIQETNVSHKTEITVDSTDNKADILSSGEKDIQKYSFQLSAKKNRLSSLVQLNELSSIEVVTSSHSKVPQPEAPINSTDCRMHLLDHVFYFQNLVKQRLDLIEADIKGN